MVRGIILTLALVCFGILTVELLVGDDYYIDPKFAKSREFKVGDMVFFKDTAVARRGDEILNVHYTVPWPCPIGKIEGDYLWLSRAYVHKKDVMSPEESLDSADQEIARNPGSWLGWRARASSWLALGEPGKALKDCDQAILLDPQAAVAYADRAEIKEVLSDLKGAIEDYDKAILFSLKRTRPNLYINRGQAKVRIHDYVGAVEDYDKAIELDPENPEAYYYRGIAKRFVGDRAAAVKDYDQAIRKNPAYWNAYWSRGRIKRACKDYEGAVKDFNECARLEPDNVDLLLERGWALDKLGRYANAIEDYKRAAELDENSFFARLNLAFMLATCPDPNVRDAVKSVQLSDAALGLRPNDAYALSAKACGLALLSKFDKAIQLEQKALRDTDFAKDKDMDGGMRSPKRIAAWKEHKQWFAVTGAIEPKSNEKLIATQARETAKQAKPKAPTKKPAAPPAQQRKKQRPKKTPIREGEFMRT